MAPGSTMGRLVNQTKRRYQAPSVPMISWNMDEAVKRLSDTIKPALPCRATSSLGIEQSVQVNDEIAHVRVVDSLLRLCLPCDVGARIVRVDADDVDLVEILELSASELAELAAEDEVKQLRFRCGRICRHGSICGSISGKGLVNSMRIPLFGRAPVRSRRHGGPDRLRQARRERPANRYISAAFL